MADMNNLPALEVADIIKALDGVTNGQVDQAGSTMPLIQCITSGVLRGVAVLLGTDGSEGRPAAEYEGFMKKLIADDILVLTIGYPEGIALDAHLVEKDGKALAGAGLKRVCELADIPPVLPLGGLEKIQNVVTIAGAVSADSGLAVPALPIVGCDAAAASAKAVELGNTFMGLGVDVYVGLLPFEGDAQAKAAELGLKNSETASFKAETDLQKLAEDIIAGLETKRAALSI